ncbi:MAG: hypothetical protein HYT87_15130 [Nitrospirae bacterium]|nr:hypothetical protein [Nitrospirota bacterium]
MTGTGSRSRVLLPAAVLGFWLFFFLAYPYRLLHDDSTFSDMLQHKYFIYHPGVRFSRLLHDALVYLQGYLDPSMEKAILVSLLGHLLAGWVAWRYLIPRMKPAARLAASAGLVAFLVHPVSLQTVVHVSQRGEILGVLFMASALALFLECLRSGTTPRRWVILTAFSAAAMASKESAALVPISLTLVLAYRSRSRAGWVAVGAAGIMLAAGVYNHPFSKSNIQNEENYRRSKAFHEAVFQGREMTNEDSLFYPLRTPAENVRLQAALVPLILKDVFFPFAVVKDYGHFPFGRQTYTWKPPWIWVGLTCILAGTAWLLRRRRAVTLPECALVISPLLLYSVYWATIPYDPLMLYRLYGVVFLTLVVALPHALDLRTPRNDIVGEKREPGRGGPSGPPKMREQLKLLPYSLALTIVLAGIARGWEMADPVRETRLELNRQPYNSRLYAFAMQERIRAGETVDCRAALAPALKLAPSTSAIYIEWAWCLDRQGRAEEAREFARKSLEQESVEGYVRLALDYLMTPEGAQLDLPKIHPFNRLFIPISPVPLPAPTPSGP